MMREEIKCLNVGSYDYTYCGGAKKRSIVNAKMKILCVLFYVRENTFFSLFWNFNIKFEIRFYLITRTLRSSSCPASSRWDGTSGSRAAGTRFPARTVRESARGRRFENFPGDGSCSRPEDPVIRDMRKIQYAINFSSFIADEFLGKRTAAPALPGNSS